MADHEPGSPDTYALSGALVAVGAAVLFSGTLFYIRLTQDLGLPSSPAVYLEALAGFGVAVGVVAFASGAGYVAGIVVLPAAIGLSVTFGCVVFAVLGVQIARHEGARARRTSPNLAVSAVAAR